jgi:hypothetical protein
VIYYKATGSLYYDADRTGKIAAIKMRGPGMTVGGAAPP